MDELSELLRFYRVPPEFSVRVINNFERNFRLGGGFDVQTSTMHIPWSLRVEVAMNMYEKFVRGSPMFHSAHRSLIQEIVTRLVPVAYNPGDWIFHEGDVGHEMMFIGSGILVVRAAPPPMRRTPGRGAR